MAKLQHLLRRASYYLNLSNNRSKKQCLSDGEIVYSKNNVCLHSIDKQTNDLNHNFGYLTVKCHYNQINTNEHSDEHKWTLCLQWTPNTCLTNNSKLLEQLCDNQSIDQYFNQNNEVFYSDSQTNAKNRYSIDNDFRNSLQNLDKLSLNLSSNNDRNSLRSIDIKMDSFDDNINRCDLSLINNNNNEFETNSSLESDKEVKRSVSTSESDINLISNSGNSLSINCERDVRRCQSCTTTPIKRHLSNECSQITTFSVDLKQIKSLRLFFGGDKYLDKNIDGCNDSTNGQNGQLVIVSRENFYKVFHFHCGGLDKLSNILNDWDFFHKCDSSKETNYLQFSICRPQLKTEECHPEEKLYISIDEMQWKNSINEFGQIINESDLSKTIFFAGIEPSLRRDIWPFLLHRYEFDSTYAERESDDKIKKEEYYEIEKKLQLMNENEREMFWRNVQSIVEKDVVRTDRSNPFFAGHNNKNIDTMKRILINFGLYCPSMGYTQGMSDLLAPLLSEIKSEDKTFWCFVGMMRMTHFVCSPKDTDMDHNLALLRELLRLMFPLFYEHISQFSDDLELLFTHRWILLCFKREFNESEALHIWESCWARYQTNYFHLFICLAIISVYGEDVISHNMNSDEILFHFSTLSMHMNGDLILRKSRGLFYQFCVLPKISCTLKNLTKSGLEMWDSNKEQLVECVKGLPNVGHLCQCNIGPNY